MTGNPTNPNESTSTHSVLTDKVTRALAVRTDTPSMKSALEALVITDPKAVRAALEDDALQQALILQQKHVASVVAHVSLLKQNCAQVAETARAVRVALETPVVTAATINAMLPTNIGEGPVQPDIDDSEEQLAATLHQAFAERDAASETCYAVQAFLDQFDLSPQDSALLDTYDFADVIDGVLTEQAYSFLDALERVHHIQRAIRSGSTNNSTSHAAASTVLDKLATSHQAAYERLYQWLQVQVTDSESTMMDPDVVRRAWRVLRRVPAFDVHLSEVWAAARRQSLTRDFLLALTTGIDGMPPLELAAHNAVAYVGDMLAFAHKVFSMEADLVKGILVSDREEEQEEPMEDESNEFTTARMTPPTMLAISMGGMARPLKSRILQVIATLARRDAADDDSEDSDEDDNSDEEEGAAARTRLVHLYEICGLLLFYRSVLETAVWKSSCGSEKSDPNPLVECLVDCWKEGLEAYEATIRVYAAMLDSVSVLTGESQSHLVEQLIVSLADAAANVPSTGDEFPELLSIGWATNTLIRAAKCESLDDVFNFKTALTAAQGAGLKDAESLRMMIESQESGFIEGLVETELAQVLDLCGLAAISEAHGNWETTDIAMASYPGLTPTEIQPALKEFYASLYAPPLPQLSRVKDSATRKRARMQIASAICHVYQDIYLSIVDSGGYTDLSILEHNPDQVRTLFSA